MLTEFHNVQCKIHTTGSHLNAVVSNFLQTVITAQQMLNIVRQ